MTVFDPPRDLAPPSRPRRRRRDGTVPPLVILLLATVIAVVVAHAIVRERRGCLAWSEYVPAAKRGHEPSPLMATEGRR